MDKPNPAGPCVFVIFGASGDLTKRLLIPALYHLKRANLLPEDFALVGVSRAPESNDQFRDRLGKNLRELSHDPLDDADWNWLAQRMSYVAGNAKLPFLHGRPCQRVCAHCPGFGRGRSRRGS
jgi:glucose-6-phosphate 1-dehydrogenase